MQLTLLIKAAFLVWLFGCGSVEADESPEQHHARPALTLGQPLASALAAYRSYGINVVSSSRLVTRRHRVTRIPARNALPDQINELLTPHQLAIRKLNEQTWYVVQLEQAAKAVPESPRAVLEPVIEEIVVTASYRLARNKATTRQLTAQQLNALPNIGGDALRAVAQLPGIASSGVSAAARVRGGNSNEVLYLLDGVELLEPFHLSEYHSLFSSINANIVDTIEVFPGAYPARLGGKMSGVVAIDLIEPTEFEGAVDLNSVVASAHTGFSTGAWSWLASARRSTLDLLLGALENDYGEPAFHDQFLRGKRTGSQSTWQFALLNSTDAVELEDPSLAEEGESSLDYRAAWLKGEFTVTDNLYSSLQFQVVHRDGEVSGELGEEDDDGTNGSLEKEISFLTFKLANNWTYHGFEQHTLEAGWFAERQNAEFVTELDARFNSIGQALRGVAAIERSLNVDRWGTVLGGYVSGLHSLGNRQGSNDGFLELDWGLRYSAQDIDPANSHAFEPRAQLTWRLPAGLHRDSDWTIALDVGRYIQHQDLFQVQIDDGLVMLQDPQKNDQIGLSIAREDRRLRTRANLYYRRIKDPWSRFDNVYNPWVLLPELHPDRIPIQASRARSLGVELLLANASDQPLSWSLSYTWSRTQERVMGNYSSRPWDQRHSLKAQIAWVGEPWQVGMSLVGRNGWPTTPLINDATALTASLYDSRLRDFWSLNLHVARSFRMFGMQGEAYLDITNSTNRTNVGGFSYTGDLQAPERRASRLLPAFPTLGLRISW